MSNVLWRFFHRQPVHEEERSCGDQALVALPPAPDHRDPGVISTAPEPGLLEAANDSQPAEAANDSRPLEPAGDPKPAKPPVTKRPSSCRSRPSCRRGTRPRFARAGSS